MSDPVAWSPGAEDEGERLDRHVADRLEVARNRIQRWIRDGRVTVDGEPAKASTPVVAGTTVECRPEEPAAPGEALEPEDEALDVLWEDEHLAVIDKPADLAVHPGAGRPTGTLAHRLLGRWPRAAGVGHPRRPGIVHRLDLDTTGALVVALEAKTYDGLGRAFAERRVQKTYTAIVWGTPEPEERTVSEPIARDPGDRKRMAVVEGGRPAVTHLRRLAAAAGISWLDVDLETGRTHQIRVHCKAIGHPLIGDPVYGEARWRGIHGARRRLLADFPRPALHALRLAFTHPITGEPIDVTAPVPEDLATLWRDVTGLEAPAGPGKSA